MIYYNNLADLSKINSETLEICFNASDGLWKVGNKFIAFPSVSQIFLFWSIPKRAIILDIDKEFIGLSNSMFTSYNCDNSVW